MCELNRRQQPVTAQEEKHVSFQVPIKVHSSLLSSHHRQHLASVSLLFIAFSSQLKLLSKHVFSPANPEPVSSAR